jgi:hypothetical protein
MNNTMQIQRCGIQWCGQCPFYKKDTEYEKTVFLDYGNGIGDFMYETKALCTMYNQYVDPQSPSCEGEEDINDNGTW